MDQQILVGVPAVAIEWALHARRPNRHSWHGQTDRVWLFFQETIYIGRRHMAFDGIAADSAGMARPQLFDNAEPYVYTGIAGIGRTQLDSDLFTYVYLSISTATFVPFRG